MRLFYAIFMVLVVSAWVGAEPISATADEPELAGSSHALTLYSYPVNVFHEGSWQAFSDVYGLVYANGELLFRAPTYSVRFEYVFVVGGEQMSLAQLQEAWPGVEGGIDLTKGKNWKFALTLSNIPAGLRNRLEAAGMKIMSMQGIEAHEIRSEGEVLYFKEDAMLDLTDLPASGFPLSSVDSTGFVVSGVQEQDALFLDPIFKLQGNVRDGYIRQTVVYDYTGEDCVPVTSMTSNNLSGMAKLGVEALTQNAFCPHDVDFNNYRVYYSFDTSEIPAGTELLDAALWFYVSKTYGDAINLNVTSGHDCLEGALDTSDWEACTTAEGWLFDADWNANGYHNKTVAVSNLDLDGFTDYRLKSDVENWTNQTKHYAEVRVRGLEPYTSTGPVLNVTYAPTQVPPYYLHNASPQNVTNVNENTRNLMDSVPPQDSVDDVLDVSVTASQWSDPTLFYLYPLLSEGLNATSDASITIWGSSDASTTQEVNITVTERQQDGTDIWQVSKAFSAETWNSTIQKFTYSGIPIEGHVFRFNSTIKVSISWKPSASTTNQLYYDSKPKPSGVNFTSEWMSSCGTLYGDYTLKNDVSSTGTCFTVAASDLKLDCNGHTIHFSTANLDGGSFYGVTAFSVSNIEVKNCKIQQLNPVNILNIGIALTATNSLIENNQITIAATQASSPGLFSTDSIGLRIINNTFNVTTNTARSAVVLQTTGNSVIENNRVVQAGGAGLHLVGNHTIYTNNSMINNTWTGKKYGLQLSTASNHTFANDTIIACSSDCDDNYADVRLDTGVWDISFLNVSFNRSSVSWAGGTQNLTVGYWLMVNVTNSSESPIDSASVNIMNATSSTPMIQTTTTANGLAGWFALTEYIATGAYAYTNGCVDQSNLTCYTPHNVSGIKSPDYGFNSSLVNVTSSQVFHLVLPAA